MNEGILGLTAQGAAASACAAAGIAMLTPHRGAALVQIAALGVAVAVWVALWHALAPLSGAVISRLAPEGLGWLGIAGLNATTATLAWVPVWFAHRRLAPGAPAMPRAHAAAALVFFAGLMLPWFGQGGAWPQESVVLSFWCAMLTLLLRGRRTKEGE